MYTHAKRNGNRENESDCSTYNSRATCHSSSNGNGNNKQHQHQHQLQLLINVPSFLCFHLHDFPEIARNGEMAFLALEGNVF